jgi:hypothetical protein
MVTKNTSDIHALTTAEIGRQIRAHSERRQQIVSERAAMYAHALKNGGTGESPIADADEIAARLHAKHLLNGSAPESLNLPPEITKDRILLREQRGLDIVLKVLSDKELVGRAADAVAWVEANVGRWRGLCREIVLAAIKLEALEHSARQLLEGCGDLTAVRLPMTLISNARSISEIPLSDLTEAALTENVITLSEIRKAKNVE